MKKKPLEDKHICNCKSPIKFIRDQIPKTNDPRIMALENKVQKERCEIDQATPSTTK